VAALPSSSFVVSSVISPGACRAPYRPRASGARELLVVAGVGDPPVRCWSWRCEGCAFLKAKDARRLAAIGIAAALDAGLPLVLLTVTEPSEARTFGASSRSLTQLMKRLQARYGNGLRWLAVVEWQTRGAVHWHIVIAGIVYGRGWTSPKGRMFPGHPPEQAGPRVRKERDLRPIVERYGFGAVFNVHAVGVRAEDTAEEVASYLSKYLAKGEDMARLPKGAQPVRSSRGRNEWAPGHTLTSIRDERRAAARDREIVGAVA
jgi:hypothetical protein